MNQNKLKAVFGKYGVLMSENFGIVGYVSACSVDGVMYVNATDAWNSLHVTLQDVHMFNKNAKVIIVNNDNDTICYMTVSDVCPNGPLGGVNETIPVDNIYIAESLLKSFLNAINYPFDLTPVPNTAAEKIYNECYRHFAGNSKSSNASSEHPNNIIGSINNPHAIRWNDERDTSDLLNTIFVQGFRLVTIRLQNETLVNVEKFEEECRIKNVDLSKVHRYRTIIDNNKVRSGSNVTAITLSLAIDILSAAKHVCSGFDNDKFLNKSRLVDIACLQLNQHEINELEDILNGYVHGSHVGFSKIKELIKPISALSTADRMIFIKSLLS